MPKKKRDETFMPMSGAGLVRFFGEDVKGIKLNPIHVIIMASALITFAILGNMGFFPFLK